MDPNYYATTLTNAAMKLGPTLIYLVVGFFLFIKLPFWIMSKVVRNNRSPFDLGSNSQLKLEEYDAFIKRINDQTVAPKSHGAKRETNEQQFRSDQRAKEKPKSTQEPKKPSPKAPPPPRLTPEEILFDLAPGQLIKKGELKRKYHELLMTHHPDKVASLAPEFKRMAEIKTKEINSAYTRLKKKAA